MSNDMTQPTAPLELRIDSIDTLRGIALFGVLAVNVVTEFRVSVFEQFMPAADRGGLMDHVVEQFIALALESKAFALFSFLFGVGLAVQFENLSRQGRALYWIGRRLVVLLLFGLAHLIFIWNGDILTEYAIAGLFAVPFLCGPRWLLAAAAIVLLLLYLNFPQLPAPVAWPDGAALQRHVAQANAIYPAGSISEIWHFSVSEIPMLLPLHVWVLPRTAALMMAGALVWRSGVLRRASKYRRGFAIAGWAGIAIGASITVGVHGGAFLRMGALSDTLNRVASMILAFGYGATVIALTQHPTTSRVLTVFGPIGRMAFTNYVMQSVLFGIIFFGYGFGLFGKAGAAIALALGVAVYIAQVIASRWWLRRFRFGPLEWLWRTFMYGERQPWRLSRSA